MDWTTPRRSKASETDAASDEGDEQTTLDQRIAAVFENLFSWWK